MKKVLIVLVVLLAMPALVFAAKAHTTEFACVSCHQVHNGNPDSLDQAPPLWGPADPCYVTSGFQMYDVDMDADPNTPTGGSRICMSCHDGLDGGTSTLVDTKDLRDHHPISFTYSDATTPYKTVLAFTATQAGLENGEVQCTSCHAVHSDTGKALREATGTLCTRCHNK